MKPWLLNILACPICKHHPLEAFIFQWEDYSPDLPSTEERKLLVNEILDGTISPPAFRVVKDTSKRTDLHELLNVVNTALETLSGRDKALTSNLNAASEKLVDQVYNYFHHEVEQGLLRCSSCERWFPIGNQVKGIPEMLPDDLRDKARDKAFLASVKDVLPSTVAEQGKPVNLGTSLPEKRKNRA